MKIKINYYLKIKNIMGKEFDIFEVSKVTTFRNVLVKNISPDKIEKIDLSEVLVIKDGKHIENLDENIENDAEFSICPKIYGG